MTRRTLRACARSHHSLAAVAGTHARRHSNGRSAPPAKEFDTDLSLQALAASLKSAHVVVHAPTLSKARVVPEASATVRAGIESLLQDLVWPIARKQEQGRILNRVRLESGGPVVPYRILACPLLSEGRVVGVVAALRTQAEPAYVPADLLRLSEAVPELSSLLGERKSAQLEVLGRPAFELEVASRIGSAEVACVVYADLDQIHAINELAGFEAADEVIREVGHLWQSHLLPEGSVATRLSGDRYAAVLINHTINQARAWADQLRQALAQLTFHGTRSRVTASLGVAALPRGGSLQHALAAAETACRVAKDRGRDRTEVYEAADATIMRRHEAVRESRVVMNALEDKRCQLFAQPIVALSAPARPVHFELLVRIQDLKGRLVSIGEYIQAAERYQLLEQLDRWVVSESLQVLGPRAERLSALGLSFAINLTGQSLSEPEFADFVRLEVKRQQLPRGLISFEFTETAAVRNLNATRRFIERMEDIGARIALDDFGTGLSSLMHLKELAVHQIKIDGKFIQDVLTDARSEALVRALCQIADSLGLETVAEFVETEAVAKRLRQLGVRLAQGYLYGRPRPLQECLDELLEPSVRVPLPARA